MFIFEENEIQITLTDFRIGHRHAILVQVYFYFVCRLELIVYLKLSPRINLPTAKVLVCLCYKRHYIFNIVETNIV